jgi:hypothetical protein
MMVMMMSIIFSVHLLLRRKNSYDYNMPPIFDDYGDENNYYVESAPTTIVHV